jgi:hypothetical protein
LNIKKIIQSTKPEKATFFLGLIAISIFYGIHAEKTDRFPANIINDSLKTWTELNTTISKAWWLRDTSYTKELIYKSPDYSDSRLTKITQFDTNRDLAVSIRNSEGQLIHKWPISWFDIWPDATHLPNPMLPKQKPGTLIHGAHIFPNGDLVFNFEYLGMVKLDVCGNTLWRYPGNTHHSIYVDEDNNIWAGLNVSYFTTDNSLNTDVLDAQIIKLSSDGELIFKKSVMKLLEENNLHGILYLASTKNVAPLVRGDTMHLNDVEVFPSSMEPGFFKPGDVMVSLRNTNTIVIFDQTDWSVKHVISNLTVRQHDPDFIDGNTISIYDNNNRWDERKDKKAFKFSRIIKVKAPENTVDVVFQGSKELPFFSSAQGKHQWLDNGNILMHEMSGRILEIDKDGNSVWEYINLTSSGKSINVTEAERLDKKLDESFFKEKAAACNKQG